MENGAFVSSMCMCMGVSLSGNQHSTALQLVAKRKRSILSVHRILERQKSENILYTSWSL